MDIYEIPSLVKAYIIPLILESYRTVINLNWTEIILNTIIYFIVLLLLAVFLVVFFDKRILSRFFSKESREYGRPFIFYLSVLSIIHSINTKNNLATIFFEILFIILIVKSIGLINTNTGEAILKILGGFALIELVLSPIINLENIESTLVIPLLLTSSLMLILNGGWKREKIILYYQGVTNFIIELLIKNQTKFG